jgi:uncharacterized Zn finger protein
MSTSLPRLTEADVQRYVPAPSFDRGRSYYHSGRVFDTVCRGDRLEARCEGSQPEPYRVTVTLGPGGIAGSDCSCPVGGGCKHVAALLLAWVHAPGEFLECEPVDVVLERKSKPELIALVQEMLKRAPELERLLDLLAPAPGTSAPAGAGGGEGGRRRTPVDPETYRRQIRYAMRDADDWRAVFSIAQEIASVVDIGDGFAAQGDWENAQIVYQAVLDEALPDYEMTHDEGDIAGEIDRAVEGLGDCLAARADDPLARRGLLRALFDVVKWNIESGGLGIGDAAFGFVLEHATAEDRQAIREWITAGLAAPSSDNEWTRKSRSDTWGRLLLSLDERDDDVEGFLRRAEAQGLYRPLFDKLVQLGRLDQAVRVANEHLATSAWERLQAADTLEAAGRPDDALALVKAGLPGNKDDRLPAWLAERYERRGDLAGALDLHLERWKTVPSVSLYQTIERLATTLDQWALLRPRLLTDLERGRRFTLLAQIHLREQDWDAAWAAAEKETVLWSNVRLEVAQASEKHRPERAMAVYLEVAERLINARGRDKYATAAGYLRRVRDLHHAMGRSDEWAQLIASLRERHRGLPALKDELNKAGL